MKLTEEFKSTIARESDIYKYIAIDESDGSVWLYEDKPRIVDTFNEVGFEPKESLSEHKHIGHSDINQYAEKLEEIL